MTNVTLVSTDKAHRNTPEKKWNISDVEFVYDNKGLLTAEQIANERGLNLFQVHQISNGLRKRSLVKSGKVTQTQILDTFAKKISKGGKK